MSPQVQAREGSIPQNDGCRYEVSKKAPCCTGKEAKPVKFHLWARKVDWVFKLEPQIENSNWGQKTGWEGTVSAACQCASKPAIRIFEVSNPYSALVSTFIREKVSGRRTLRNHGFIANFAVYKDIRLHVADQRENLRALVEPSIWRLFWVR